MENRNVLTDKPLRILVIPDTQCKEGIPMEHLTWAGKAIVDYLPDVVVHLGDHADMPSLSTYEKKGSKYFEGKRYTADIAAARAGMALLLTPLREYQAKLKKGKRAPYNPRMVFITGNHENRIKKAIDTNPVVEGLISIDDLHYKDDWEVHDFLSPVFINSVGFCHYWPTGVMCRASATPAATLRNLHMSCIAGHQQGKQVAYGKRADGAALCAIICGSYYQHDEDYIPALGNKHWRGLLICNEVIDGTFDELFLSINYLERRYSKCDLPKQQQ